MLHGAQRILAYQALPPRALKCGNCMLAAAVVPLELLGFGALLLMMCIAGTRYLKQHLFAFSTLLAGIVLTPAVVGVPVFGFGLVLLALSLLAAVYRKYRRRHSHE